MIDQEFAQRQVNVNKYIKYYAPYLKKNKTRKALPHRKCVVCEEFYEPNLNTQKYCNINGCNDEAIYLRKLARRSK